MLFSGEPVPAELFRPALSFTKNTDITAKTFKHIDILHDEHRYMEKELCGVSFYDIMSESES